MSKIKLLDEKIISKIAAGEVIERPASIVKELIENSLDASANDIKIFIKDGGKSLIKVIDNGVGMDLDDLKKCFLRHATSKINSESDLFSIRTLGFRGEALASIVTIANVEIISKTRNNPVAYKLITSPNVINNPQDVIIKEVGAPNGTSITVSDIFYNVPVRKKFLKSSIIEQKHILNIVIQYSLCYTNVSFRVYNNKKLIFNAPKTDSLIHRVNDVYGEKIASNLLKVNFSNGIISINGVIGKPNISKTEDYQSFYVNKRYIKSKLISNAVQNAYKSMLFLNRKPLAILNLTIDPSKIDVNIHPTKQEIKFDNEEFVYMTVYTAIKEVLDNNNLFLTKNRSNDKYNQQIHNYLSNNHFNNKSIVDIDNQTDSTKTLTYKNKVEKEIGKHQIIKDNVNTPRNYRHYKFKDSYQSILKETDNSNVYNNHHFDKENKSDFYDSSKSNMNFFNDNQIKKETTTNNELNNNSEIISSESDKKGWVNFKNVLNDNQIKKVPFQSFKVLGQIDYTYIILETDRSMAIVDQHAAHERINFEKIKNKFDNSEVSKQRLLSPRVIKVHPKNIELLKSKLSYFENLGFEIEYFQGNDFLVRTIPSFLQIKEISGLIDEILLDLQNFNNLKQNKERQKEDKEKLLNRKVLETMACRMSIKAGKELTLLEMNDLIISLMKCNRPFTCPHGRPTLIEFTSSDLEKMFQRKV